MANLRCLRCGVARSKRVVYGYPGVELVEAAERGELVLGGCDPGRPVRVWFCDDCERAMSPDERQDYVEAAESGDSDPGER